MSSIRIAIVEDDRVVRENLALLIDGSPGFSCVAKCASAEEAWQELPDVRPDVVLMDIHLPHHNGVTCVARLRALLPKTQVIMLTIEEDIDRVFESLKAGATGYLVKHSSPHEILEAVQEVHSGGAPMSSHIARQVVTAFRNDASTVPIDAGLTPREEQTLRLLSKGLRSKEIGETLGVCTGTVNAFVRKIYEKLHVRSRAQAVAKYVKKR